MTLGTVRRIRHSSLKANDRVAAWLDNAFDWLFMRGTLVQSGLTGYDTLLEGDPMTLRYYPLPGTSRIELADGGSMAVRRERHAVPVILIPPLGVTGETFDLLPQRSLVRYMAARGFHTYMIDWGRPERRHAHLSLHDYALDMLDDAVREVRRHSGARPVTLMGWCMGGLLALMYAGARRDRYVRNIVTVASPIDMRSGGLMALASAALNTPSRLIRRFSSFRLHNLNPAHLQTPGWMTTLAFKLTDPVRSVTTYWDLLTRLADRDYVEIHSTMSDYLDHMLMYPAGVARDVLIKLVVDNRLAQGTIDLDGSESALSEIRANLLVYAGEDDHLVSPATAQRVLDLVSSRDKAFRVAPGGHMGVMLGSEAQQAVWEASAAWLDTRSAVTRRRSRSPEAEQSRRRARARRLAEDPTV